MFIVIEGTDGAGTTTQALALTKRFEPNAIFTHEPSKGEFGLHVRSLFTRDDGKPLPDWQIMAFLFAADRLDHLKKVIEPALAEGKIVFCDRCYHSSIGYQSASAKKAGSVTLEEDTQWLKIMNFHARCPDAVVVLDVPFEVAQARDSKEKSPDKYASQHSLQRHLINYYGELEKHFPMENILHVDGTQPIEKVTSDIVLKLQEAGMI